MVTPPIASACCIIRGYPRRTMGFQAGSQAGRQDIVNTSLQEFKTNAARVVGCIQCIAFSPVVDPAFTPDSHPIRRGK